MIITNSFSLNMISQDRFNKSAQCTVSIERISVEIAKNLIESFIKLGGSIDSAIGHDSTARIVSSILGINIPFNRKDLALSGEEDIIVAQYIGPRLPEGATSLPDGAKIEFYKVYVYTVENDNKLSYAYEHSFIGE